MLKLTKLMNKLRAQTVKRWTIVHTTKQQSLAEHSFNVALIAQEICERMAISSANVMRAALVHDLDEILTGDIPSPFKRYAESHNMEINVLSSAGLEDLNLSDQEILILKTSDHIENTWFINEFAAGRHAEQVAKEQTHFFFHVWLKKFEAETYVLGCIAHDIMDGLLNDKYKAWPKNG